MFVRLRNLRRDRNGHDGRIFGTIRNLQYDQVVRLRYRAIAEISAPKTAGPDHVLLDRGRPTHNWSKYYQQGRAPAQAGERATMRIANHSCQSSHSSSAYAAPIFRR